MPEIAINAEHLRLPSAARDALEHGTRVLITRYGKPTGALLNWQTYNLVVPLLELLEEGVVVSPELLMTNDDIALIADLAADEQTTPAEEELIDALLAAEQDAR